MVHQSELRELRAPAALPDELAHVRPEELVLGQHAVAVLVFRLQGADGQCSHTLVKLLVHGRLQAGVAEDVEVKDLLLRREAIAIVVQQVPVVAQRRAQLAVELVGVLLVVHHGRRRGHLKIYLTRALLNALHPRESGEATWRVNDTQRKRFPPPFQVTWRPSGRGKRTGRRRTPPTRPTPMPQKGNAFFSSITAKIVVAATALSERRVH
eukprot:scaffold536_cov250-Pinguiococcus_pyrenoidosus.AAC.31